MVFGYFDTILDDVRANSPLDFQLPLIVNIEGVEMGIIQRKFANKSLFYLAPPVKVNWMPNFWYLDRFYSRIFI